MKKLSVILSAAILAVCASCSSGSDSKTITPTSTEFASGELARYIEVVDQPSELTFTEKDGVIPTQFIRLKVTLKLTKDGLKDVDARDINFEGFSAASIKLVDETGTDIQDLEIKYEESLKLKKLLTGNEGDTSEIVFEGEFHNSDDAPNWFKNASQFTPSLTCDISTEDSSESEFESEEASSTTGIQPSDIILPSQLKGAVEVINGESGSITVDKGVGDIPEINITFKLLKKVSTSSMENSYGQVFIYGVPQDASGRTISEIMPNYNEWRSGDSDGNQFKEFLTGEVGGTITLSFSGTSPKYSDNCDNENGCKKIAKFKLAFNRD